MKRTLILLVLVSVSLSPACRLDEFEDAPPAEEDFTVALVCDTPFADQVRGDASFSFSADVNGVTRTGFSFVVEGNIGDGAGYDSKYFIEIDELFLDLTITRNAGALTGLELATDCSADDDCSPTTYTASLSDDETSFTEELNPLTGLEINQTILTVSGTFNSSGSDTVEFSGTFWELISCE